MNYHDDPKRALHKAIWLPCWILSRVITRREFTYDVFFIRVLFYLFLFQDYS